MRMHTEIVLTEEQQSIIDKNGCFVVNACPGSGKTLAVAARVAKRVSDWQHTNRGIAAISFTNVAWQEIENYLYNEFYVRATISYPHFLGTIDSFINKYIFLPFGHLVMGCCNRPKLVGPPYDEWEPIQHGWYWQNAECNQKICKLNDFSYDAYDKLLNFAPRSHFDNCKSQHKFCKKLKKEFNNKGYVTQLDANYFAMKILQEYPQIAEALSYRFPMIIIDEAQDSSEIQLKIIDLLIENGHTDIMLIGDPDQAIFEWRTANPHLFIDKYNQWSDNSFRLNENWRSSQNICDFFSKVSSCNEVPTALNVKYKDFSYAPQIWGYANKNCNDIVEKFLGLCRKNDIEIGPKNIAVLVRSKELLQGMQAPEDKKVRNNVNPWRDVLTKNIAKSKYLFDSSSYKESLFLMEKPVYKIIQLKHELDALDLPDFVHEYGFVEWRRLIFSLIWDLPKTKGITLKEWIADAAKILKNHQIELEPKIKKDRRPNFYSAMNFDELFNDDTSKVQTQFYTLGTVHSVKGETFDAVLLILKSRGGNNQKYANILISKASENEELRTIYVAITRPRKILVIAVPKEDKEVWAQKFLE